MRVCLVATMKNEAPHLLEWVAWHRLAGFDDLIVAQNHSDDLTDAILETLAGIGAVDYFDNGDALADGQPPASYQWRAYARAARRPAYKAADWVMPLDGDEFLFVSTGDGRVQDLARALGRDADQILVHWRSFGSGGEQEFRPGLVTERFTTARPEVHVRVAPTCFKPLFRRDVFDMSGVHWALPRSHDLDRIVTASGARLRPEDLADVSAPDRGGPRLAQINHYRVRDPESFLMARARGRASRHSVQLDLAYWALADATGAIDARLAGRAPDIRAEMARLDAASGGRLSALTAEACAIWQARIAALRAEPGMARLHAEVLALQAALRNPAADPDSPA